MSFTKTRGFSRALLLLATLLICLPSALGQTPSTQPATSKPAEPTSAPASQTSERDKELREGRRMMKETAAVYRDCKSYQDEGEVVITYLFKPARPYTERFPFKTAFGGQEGFRFEFTDNYSDCGTLIVWGDKSRFLSWSHRRPEGEQHWTRDDALQKCLTLTDRRSNTVLTLLFPQEFGGMQWKQLQNVQRIDQEGSHGVVCDILVAKNEEGQPVRIWIDVKTRLVRKIVMRRRYWGDQYAEFTTTYKPKINADIPAADLEFNPPKE